MPTRIEEAAKEIHGTLCGCVMGLRSHTDTLVYAVLERLIRECAEKVCSVRSLCTPEQHVQYCRARAILSHFGLEGERE